jgi:hypothetical protein
VNIRNFIISVLITILFLSLSYPDEMEDIVPESTLVFASVNNFPTFSGELLKGELQDFQKSGEEFAVEALRGEIRLFFNQLEKRFGCGINELKKIFTGKCLFFITQLEIRDSGRPVYDLNLILEHNGNIDDASHFMEGILKFAPEDAIRKVKKYSGLKIHLIEYNIKKPGNIPRGMYNISLDEAVENDKNDQMIPGVFMEFSYHFEYAISEKYLFLCEGRKNNLRHLIERSEKVNQSSLRRKESYRKVFGNAPLNPPLLIFINSCGIISEISRYVKNRFNLNIEALNPEEIKAVGICLGFHQDYARLFTSLYVPAPRKGIFSMLFQFKNSKLSTLDFMPEDTIACRSISMDLYEVYIRIIRSFTYLYPEITKTVRRTIILNGFSAGIDLERDIIGAMNGEMGFFMRKNPGKNLKSPPVEVYFTSIENSEKMKISIMKFFRLLKQITNIDMIEKEFRKVKYWIPAQLGPGIVEEYDPGFYIMLTNDYLFLTTELFELKDIIIRLKNEKKDSFGARKDIRRILSQYPKKNRIGFSYFSREEYWTLIRKRGGHKSLWNETPFQKIVPPVTTMKPGIFYQYILPGITLFYQEKELFYLFAEIPMDRN